MTEAAEFAEIYELDVVADPDQRGRIVRATTSTTDRSTGPNARSTEAIVR